MSSDTSHEENVIFIFEESRTLHSNQPVNEVKEKKHKQQSFIKSIKERINWRIVRQFFYFLMKGSSTEKLIINDFLELLGLVGYYNVGNSSLLLLTMKKS
ncbi:hypothetical protein [Fictibacillus sp. BK138]|uniref:hypothetical protein n=1 Tax=Fictibacillus sp. BK138 TaxID=2512121 RepID=UPI0013EE646E|nr:hypothetical protein [Fictibacillus sp. BK138]